MTQSAAQKVIQDVKFLLVNNKIPEALEIINTEFSPISNDLGNSALLISGRHNRLREKATMGLITAGQEQVETSQIQHSLLMLLDGVDNELEIKKITSKRSTLYTTDSEEALEKIQGPKNTLVPTSWLHKAIQVSKSVCQVIRSDGKKGTGWLLNDGWMMTNAHVLPNIKHVESSKILLDFEEDLFGAPRKTSEFFLESAGALFSPITKFDYAYVRIKDSPANPISNWGTLELDLFSDPQLGDFVNIIQHPLGEAKQIALTRNSIVAIDNSKVFYKTDTEKGSSGSPVFNQEWKVIALHHAGKTEEEGGMTINKETGEKMAANEGILIKNVMEDIKSKQ